MNLDLTKRADYAIRAMLALAQAGEDERLSVRRIAADQDIPSQFLRRIMSDLVRAGLIHSVAGRSGGYLLARPATSVSILDVIEAVEGDGGGRTCVLRGGPCGVSGECRVHLAFSTSRDGFMAGLAGASFADLVARGTPSGAASTGAAAGD